MPFTFEILKILVYHWFHLCWLLRTGFDNDELFMLVRKSQLAALLCSGRRWFTSVRYISWTSLSPREEQFLPTQENEWWATVCAQSVKPPSQHAEVDPHLSINQHLSTISNTKEEFEKSKESYQKALNASDHHHTLEFIETTKQHKKRKKRSRNLRWFNQLYNASVTTNIGASFLQLLDKHFPTHYTRSWTVKVSYSCTKQSRASCRHTKWHY